MSTVEVSASPLVLEIEAAQADQRAQALEEEARGERREAARLRATAVAVRARDSAVAVLGAAVAAEQAAQQVYDGAGAAEREALRRVAAAESEVEHAQDAAQQAAESAAEPAVMIERDEHLTSAARILDHERVSLERARAARVEARRSLDRAREEVRQGRQALTEAEQVAENPTYVDPSSPGGLLDAFARTLAPGLTAGLQRAGIAGFGH